MATGDLNNHLMSLMALLRQHHVSIKYHHKDSFKSGNPLPFIKLFIYLCGEHNKFFKAMLFENHLEVPQNLIILSDDEDYFKPLLEHFYRIFRSLDYKPKLTVDQFLSKGFKEWKVIMCCSIVSLIGKKCQEMGSKSKVKKMIPGISGLPMIYRSPNKVMHGKSAAEGSVTFLNNSIQQMNSKKQTKREDKSSDKHHELEVNSIGDSTSFASKDPYNENFQNGNEKFIQ